MAKTASGLVAFVKTKVGNPYLYGFKQNNAWNKKCSLSEYKNLKKLYGSMIWDSDQAKCVGNYPCDCSGLISAYTEIQRGSSNFKETATKVLPIKDIDKAVPGCALWHQGHIGVYIGDGYYIAEDGSAYGCRKAKVSANSWTHILWLKDITYDTEKKATAPAKTTTTITYYKKYTGKSDSFVDALKAVGVTDTSLAARKKIAALNGIASYTGTSAQNTKLLTLLKQGKLIKKK